MIVWLNVDGSVGEIVSSYNLTDEDGNSYSAFSQREGNLSAGGIFVYFEGGNPSGGLAYSTWEFPTGDVYPTNLRATWKRKCVISFDKSRDMRKFRFEKEYEMQYFPFPAWLTANGGDGIYKVGITDSAVGKTYAYGPILLTVASNAVIKETSITSSEYAELIAELQGKLDKIAGNTEEALAYVKLPNGSQSSMQASEKALPNAIAVRDQDGNLALPNGEKAVGQSEGDSRWLVKAEGAGAQVVDNKAVFSEGIDVFFKKDGNKRITITSGNTLLMNEAGDARIYVGLAGVTADGNFVVKPEGNAPTFVANGAKAIMQDPTGVAGLTASETGVDVKGKFRLAEEPTEGKDAATKAYVDQAVATGGDLQLNIENGTGGGSLKSRSAKDASGLMSLALGFNASASGGNSIAIGSGADNQADHGVAFGYGVTNKGQTGSMVFGKYYTASDSGACFTFGWMDQALLTLGSSSNAFLKPTTFQSDVEVLGTFTARRFEAIEAENLTTGNFTIGLGKGNTTAVGTLMGMYCEKYDGANYGCLAWDKTGTAYVGDCQVGPDGAISDPSKTLQPILTRDRDAGMGDGCAIFWDATRLKAVTNSAIRAFGLDGVSLGGVLSVSGGKAEYSGAIDGDACVATKKYVDDAATSVIIRSW